MLCDLDENMNVQHNESTKYSDFEEDSRVNLSVAISKRET